MYICKDCGQTFTDLFYIGKDPYAGDDPVFACPFCHRLDYTEAVYCNLCERWKDPDKVKVRYGVCDDCLQYYCNSYIAVDWLLKSEADRKEFMSWSGIPQLMDDAFVDALRKIRTTHWEPEDRARFLKPLKAFFREDKDWFTEFLLPQYLNAYDYGHFAGCFSAKKFLRFLCCNWDATFPVWDWFTAYFYDVNDANDVLTQSLLRYMQTQIEAAEKESESAQNEVGRFAKRMTDFAKEKPYVMISYCIYCEGEA